MLNLRKKIPGSAALRSAAACLAAAVLLGGSAAVPPAVYASGTEEPDPGANPDGEVPQEPQAPTEALTEPRYARVFAGWAEAGYEPARIDPLVLAAEDLEGSEGAELISDPADLYDRAEPAWQLEADAAVAWTIDIPEDGLYDLSFTYLVQSNGLLSAEAGLTIDGEFPFYEARRVTFPVRWQNSDPEFSVDEDGNDISPQQTQLMIWLDTFVADPAAMWPGSLNIYLEEGEHEFRLAMGQGAILLGDITLSGALRLPSYEQYRSDGVQTADGESVGVPADPGGLTPYLAETDAAYNLYKNDTAPRPMNSRDISVTPYDTYLQKLNVFGGDTWNGSGEEAAWEIEVPESGFYQLAFRYVQNTKDNAHTFRTLRVNGSIPFAEARSFVFPYSEDYGNLTFGPRTEDGRNPAAEDGWLVWLEEGSNILSLEADASPYSNLVETMQDIITEISDLGLEIRLLTGNNQDPFRDWVISDYIEDIDGRLLGMADRLDVVAQEQIEAGNLEARNLAASNIRSVLQRLRNLAAEPDLLPSRLNQLSEGTGSINQTLSDTIVELQKQPLFLDKIYVYRNKELPRPEGGFLMRISESLKRFFNTFRRTEAVQASDDALDVWVSRARVYVDLMQQMADSRFTADTGIPVNISLTQDESKLILSNAAGTHPDLALGLSVNVPFDFAIRGTAKNLREYADFTDTARQFAPGAILAYALDEGIYGLPETQDFYVTFYREDILQELNIPVPDTWEEVVQIMPELQRYGMNYYSPLSSESAGKPFMFTSPFIYQNGGDIYAPDGRSTQLTSEASIEALSLMTDLFTIYGLPLQVPSFYNEFRYGTLPIGIANFENYLRLKTAAPEIAGSWSIAPSPGIEGEDGEVLRWNTGSAQGTMIFGQSEKPDEAWDFLSWWLSEETQTDFAYQIQTLYGDEYIWNTANLAAFANLPWEEEHKDVILAQWEWMREVPRVPGGYIVERELSNTWNEIVFEDANPRSTIDDKTLIMNRELERKLTEFGYLRDGEVVRDFSVPTLEDIERWLAE